MSAFGKRALNVLILFLGAIVGIVVVIGVMLWEEAFIVPKNFLFYEQQGLAGILHIWLIMVPVCLFLVTWIKKLGIKSKKQLEEVDDAYYLWNYLGRGRRIVIFLWLISLYCCMMHMTVVTKDSIIYYSPLHPTGITYSYSDVEEINAGFGKSRFAFLEYKKKGNFFYQIQVDGRQITFHQPNVNGEIEKYEEDTYLELEEFDEALVQIGIPKKSDKEGYLDCDLDSEYVERFLRIIERKQNT